MNNGTIQSLERGLTILTILAKAGSPMTLNEIAASFKIDRSSVFRLIKTMVKAGFIYQDNDTKRYSLGFKVLELAGSFSDNLRLEEFLRPIMKDVCRRTNQNTHLAILDRGEVVFIAVEQPRDAITISISIGTRESATQTALGRAILAFMEKNTIDEIIRISPLERYTPKSIVSKTELYSALSGIRDSRLAVDNEEYKPGVICFASPVLNHKGQVVCSIGISGLDRLIMPHYDEYGETVKEAAIKASALLGQPV
ncbi:MAG TPA: IclR family transcriptional regulator [Desulfomonilia bacterium]